jgi:carboxymethylenebutenolidase
VGEMIEFPANGRTCSGYLASPAGGKGPGLVVLQEWWGLVDHIKGVCDRFAAEGFVVLAPDLYHGTQTRSPDEAGKLLLALNLAKASTDLRGAADALTHRREVEPKKIAVVGFCMGGQLALYGAAEHPDRFVCAVNFYGVHSTVKIEPSRVKVPVLAHFGTRDTSTPESVARRMVEQIQAAGGSIEAHFYDAGHAFFNDSRPTAYDKASASLAWTRTLEFLRRQLWGEVSGER